MHALAENKTWDLVGPAKVIKLIGCKRVFKVKYINKYKARLVAKGYVQTHDINRVLLAITLAKG